MKKGIIFFLLLAGMLLCGMSYSQVNTGQVITGQADQGQVNQAPADYAQVIIGTWKFDLGSGYMATIDYLSDGTFIQQVDEMIIKGTYTVTGRKLKTVTKGKATLFTIVSYDNRKLTVRRDRDGRTIVYEKS